MTVVIADTSPLNYLLLIGEISILPSLYGQIFIPPEVLDELSDAGAPPEVLRWIQMRPAWLQVRQVRKPKCLRHVEITLSPRRISSSQSAGDTPALDSALSF